MDLPYAVPILSAEHIYQQLAIVRVSNGQVAIGENKLDAIRKFQGIVAAGGGNNLSPDSLMKVIKFLGRIDRVTGDVQGGNTVYFITLQEQNKIFTGSSQIGPSLPLVRPGDTVEIEFMSGEDQVSPLRSLKIRPQERER